MCGIVGYIGNENATQILIDGLRCLEYRGYDSAGIAVLNGGDFQIARAQGKLKNLEEKIKQTPVTGKTGIGHTRWATHGRPSEDNAHPHRAGPIVVVHNGIIENHVKLRAYLTEKGHTMKSETDTELVCHLIQQRLYDGMTMEEAFRRVLTEIEGSYALVVLNQTDPDRLYIARNGSPLVVGLGKGESLVASDVPALIARTRNVLFLEDRDFGILTRDKIDLWDGEGRKVERKPQVVDWTQTMAEKGGYKHFMLKEIFEQPRSFADTLNDRISENRQKVILSDLEKLFPSGKFPYQSVTIIACGTSYHAGLVGKYWIEELARVPVNVDLASEFRYRNPLIDDKTLLIAVSQSGETADTLAALKDAREKGAKILSICNVIGSSIPRASDATLYTRAGPEIGVASTKAFTTQLLVLLLLALYLGDIRKTITPEFLKEALEALAKVPEEMNEFLKHAPLVEKIAKSYLNVGTFLYFGRGIHYPIALEGALKLKEISYIHAEGYAAGEMKHGPIALIDENTPVLVLAPQDKVYEKVLSNMEEVKARGARVIGVGLANDTTLLTKCENLIPLPETTWYLNPFFSTLPLQLLAYYIADHRGTDVDQPRNLAKSVTVE